MYKLNPQAEMQRGFRIPPDYNVERYVREGLYYPDLLTSDRVIIVTVDHNTYGFNAVSAMILEYILSNTEKADSVSQIASLFQIESARVMSDFENTLDFLLQNNIIVEEVKLCQARLLTEMS